jgi:tetratricopeptide (TPR) repeat protein
MNGLAFAYEKAGKLDQAVPLLEEILKLLKAKLGPAHPETLDTMNHLAEPFHQRPDHTGAHLDLLATMNSLGAAYWAAGKLNQAVPLLEETLKLRKAKLGPEHPDRLVTMNNLAVAYEDAGKQDQALPLYEATLQGRKAKRGPDHHTTVFSLDQLAGAYVDAGKLDQAEALYRERLAQKNDDLTATIGLARVLLERATMDTANPARAQERAAEGERLLRDYLAQARIRHTTGFPRAHSSA